MAEDVPPTECPLCGRKFKGEHGLRAHVSVIHIDTDDNPYACGNARTYRDLGCRCPDCTAAYNDSIGRKPKASPPPSLTSMQIDPKPEWDKALTHGEVMAARGESSDDDDYRGWLWS